MLDLKEDVSRWIYHGKTPLQDASTEIERNNGRASTDRETLRIEQEKIHEKKKHRTKRMPSHAKHQVANSDWLTRHLAL